MYCEVPSVTKDPRVPEQQKALLWLLTFPPETPRCGFRTWWFLPLSASSRPGVTVTIRDRTTDARSATLDMDDLLRELAGRLGSATRLTPPRTRNVTNPTTV